MQRSGLEITGCCEQLSLHQPTLIGRSALLEDMTPDEVDALGRAMRLVRAAPGQVLIREGEFGDWMLLILKGTVDVTKQIARRGGERAEESVEDSAEDVLAGLDRSETQARNAADPADAADAAPSDGNAVSESRLKSESESESQAGAAAGPVPTHSRVAVLRPGAAIGEMSMLDGGLRYTSCTAIDEVEAGVLSRHAIALLIRDHPTVGAKLLVRITQLMAQRLRNTGNHLVRLLRTRQHTPP